MTTYKCRTVLPKKSGWFEMEAGTPEQAANDFHEAYHPHTITSAVLIKHDEGGRYKIAFAKIEVEGFDCWISKIYLYGIWRRGGVSRRPETTIEDIAKAIEWNGDPQELLQPFEGEETMEKARNRG